MSYDFNPYASPAAVQMKVPSQRPLAGLGKRFVGALIDGFAGLVFMGPGYAMLIAGGDVENDELTATSGLGLGLIVLGGLALLGVQIYLMVTNSQTIGKYLIGTQVVDYETGLPANFVKMFVLRAFVNSLIGAIPCVGGLYSIVDILCIFRDDRRCLHDQIAGTSVVDIS